MAAGPKKPKYTIHIDTPADRRSRKSTVLVMDAERKPQASDKADLSIASERRRVGKELARQLGDDDVEKWRDAVEEKWKEYLDKEQRHQEQLATGSTNDAPLEALELLDSSPPIMSRPLTLIEGRAYAAAWANVERRISESKDRQTGATITYDPPLRIVEPIFLVIRDDGQLFTDAALSHAQPLCELGFEVRLPLPLPPGREWSGAGLKRYQAKKRPDPVEVFGRIVAVVNRFLDFTRSLAPQETMCELLACYIVSTYFLEAFNVIGYLWSNGDKGAGKSACLQVVSELAYLGQFILSGSTYPTLRDLADYGATLAFDDAEDVMNVRHTDPDKRTLLLAGSRRGATTTFKEQVGDKWEIRYVNTFCPRLFSATRLPDDILGSRSIIIPQVKTRNPQVGKATVMDPALWPEGIERQPLIDDLWALGLTHLEQLRKYDRFAADAATLWGRDLDPWRSILAVAGWLDDQQGMLKGLYERMEKLSQQYQRERRDLEENNPTRLLFRTLLQMSSEWESGQTHKIQPKAVAEAMNAIARAEDLSEPDKEFTNARKVGRLLQKLRFRKEEPRSSQGRFYKVTREEIVTDAEANGVEVDPPTPS